MLHEWQNTLIDQIAHKTRHQHILQPLLWLCALIGVPLIVAATKSTGLLQQELFGVLVFLVLYVIIANTYWTFKEPDRLQSETFRLNNRQQNFYESQQKEIQTKKGIIDDPEWLVPVNDEQLNGDNPKALPFKMKAEEND